MSHEQWLTIASASVFLDMSADALRRALERRAVRAEDGGTEARLDGVVGRKLGRSWRVFLAPAWTAPGDVVGSEARGARIGPKGNPR